mgnify:CR=1 FL=1
MAARDLRYEWFYQLVEKLDAQAIAVAHHADEEFADKEEEVTNNA